MNAFNDSLKGIPYVKMRLAQIASGDWRAGDDSAEELARDAFKVLLELENPASLCGKPEDISSPVQAQTASMSHAAPVDAQDGGACSEISVIEKLELLKEYTGPYGIETPSQAIDLCIKTVREHKPVVTGEISDNEIIAAIEEGKFYSDYDRACLYLKALKAALATKPVSVSLEKGAKAISELYQSHSYADYLPDVEAVAEAWGLKCK